MNISKIFIYLIFAFSFFYSANASAVTCASDGSDCKGAQYIYQVPPYAASSTVGGACLAYKAAIDEKNPGAITSFSYVDAQYPYCVENNQYNISVQRIQNTFYDANYTGQCGTVNDPYVLYFDTGTSVPQTTCIPASGGGFCKYVNSGSPVINSSNTKQNVILSLASGTTVSSCEETTSTACDSSDPYGGCYKIPDDGCTRTSNGSIVCPDNTPTPTVATSCGSATYCTNTSGTCASGYVSGTFNGENICVKTSASTSTGTDTGTDTGTGTGTDTGTTTGTGSAASEGTTTGTGSTGTGSTGTGSSSSSSSSSSSDSNWPKACEWFSAACEFFGWMKEEPTIESKDLPSRELTSQSFSETLFGSGSASCPPDSTRTISLPGGKSFTLTFSYSKLCPYLVLISWIFVAFGYVTGAAIVIKWS